MSELFRNVGLVAGIILPLFNIPLITKIIKRRSSKDISLIWVLGVWVCIVLMSPSAFTSDDIVFRIFSYINVTMFTLVVITVLRYRGVNE